MPEQLVVKDSQVVVCGYQDFAYFCRSLNLHVVEPEFECEHLLCC